MNRKFNYISHPGAINQMTNGPVNAYLISEPIQNLNKMAEKTLIIITNNPISTYSSYKTNLIPGHRLQ